MLLESQIGFQGFFIKRWIPNQPNVRKAQEVFLFVHQKICEG